MASPISAKSAHANDALLRISAAGDTSPKRALVAPISPTSHSGGACAINASPPPPILPCPWSRTAPPPRRSGEAHRGLTGRRRLWRFLRSDRPGGPDEDHFRHGQVRARPGLRRGRRGGRRDRAGLGGLFDVRPIRSPAEML